MTNQKTNSISPESTPDAAWNDNLPLDLTTNCRFKHGSTDLMDLRNSDDLKRERVRLASFLNWPSTAPQNQVLFARAGFFYLNSGIAMKCVFCKVILNDAGIYDTDPNVMHRAVSPCCPFINGQIVGNSEFDEKTGVELVHLE